MNIEVELPSRDGQLSCKEERFFLNDVFFVNEQQSLRQPTDALRVKYVGTDVKPIFVCFRYFLKEVEILKSQIDKAIHRTTIAIVIYFKDSKYIDQVFIHVTLIK